MKLIGALLLLFSPAQADTLIYSNDVMGEVEPCGCRENPRGGMLRRFHFQKTLKGTRLLQIDAGNLLFDSTSIPEPLRDQAEIQAGFVIQSMNELGLQAFTPGPNDFALGEEALQRLLKKAKFKAISANLYQKGKRVFKPYVLLPFRDSKGKKRKLAVFGLSGENLKWPEGITVKPALKEAKNWINKLRKKADLLFAVTHQGYEADVQLAEAYSKLDGIIGGHTHSFLQTPHKFNGVLVFQSDYRHQHIGVLPLRVPFSVDEHELHELDEEYEKGGSSKIAKLTQEFKKAIADFNSKESAETQANSQFQTFPRCVNCHTGQFHFWRKTQHGIALSSLKGPKQLKNKECLSCHTLALEKKAGFQT